MQRDKVQFDLMFFKLSSAVSGFLLALEVENRTPDTLRYYREKLGKFLWFAEQNDFPNDVRELNAGHVRMFLSYVQNKQGRWHNPTHTMSAKPTKAITVQRYRATLHALFNWLVNEEIVEVNPVARVRIPKVEQKVIEPLSDYEMRRLVDACRHSSKRDLAVVLLLLDTGLRASELCSLKLEHWQERRIKVFGKGRKERWLALSATTAKALWDYMTKERGDSFYDEMFLSHTGAPLTPDSLASLLDRRAKDAGIRHVYPHLLRHTFAVSWARSGGPLHALQTLLGHSTPHMSLRYGRMASEEACELHRSYSPVERMNLRLREKK